MKFQNPSLNFFEQTEGRTHKLKAICSPLFQSWGHKNDGARVLTRLYDVFSDAQGQLTPKSAAEFCPNSNSSKLL